MSDTAQEILGLFLGITILIVCLIGTILYFSNENDRINMPFKLSCIEKGYIYDSGDCTTLISTKNK